MCTYAYLVHACDHVARTNQALSRCEKKHLHGTPGQDLRVLVCGAAVLQEEAANDDREQHVTTCRRAPLHGRREEGEEAQEVTRAIGADSRIEQKLRQQPWRQSSCGLAALQCSRAMRRGGPNGASRHEATSH